MSARVAVTIERLGVQGDGVAPGPLYAPRCLPGEEIEGVVEGDRLTDLRILTPAPERVAAPCRHYKSCGGCALQHADDGFVAAWKAGVIAHALSAQGLEAPVRPTLTSPAASRHRAAFSGRRTKAGALVGFHARASDTLTAVPNCRVLDPRVVATLPALEALTRAGGSRKGEVTLTVTASEVGPDVAVTGGKPLEDALRVTLAGIARDHTLARLSWADETLALVAAPVQRMGRARVTPPPGGFLQATRHGQDALTEAVRGITAGAARVADLFAGAGTFALPLAEDAEVHAVEGNAEALAALDAGWRAAPGLKRVTTEARDLFRRPLMADELARFDALVLDPPRAGAQAQMPALRDAGPSRIAYVSCNPATFARDVAALAPAYRLDWVQPVDQFRWSPHVELVAQLTRLTHP